VLTSSSVMAFMDVNPATPGHVLVVPRIHVAGLWDLPEDLARELMAATWRAARAIRRVLRPEGLNLRHSTGLVAGQDVFHTHLHLVPRYQGDTLGPGGVGRCRLESTARRGTGPCPSCGAAASRVTRSPMMR
jgi:histidine triad (HIT) family protein